jgi:hypothetical protein
MGNGDYGTDIRHNDNVTKVQESSRLLLCFGEIPKLIFLEKGAQGR